VAEVSKNKLRELGSTYAYQGSPGAGGFVNGGGPGSLEGVGNGVLTGTFGSTLNLLFLGGNSIAAVRALQTNGALRALAEPNLIAMDGQVASFLAGGEFPIPVAQAGANAGAISVVFREYGIKLSFLPQITANGTIRLHVKPEVSSIDSGNGVTVSGINIPALSTRRMETDIELGQGQSFVIGGLIDDRVIQNLSQVPGLAHIPILGALFKSRQLTKSKTELVVVVTPEMASPARGAMWEIPMPIPFLPPAVREAKEKTSRDRTGSER
jgi:pilus assembly protein CpaC